MSAKIAIVYHSGYGHTGVVAEHVLKGADGVDGVEAKLYKADDLGDPESGPWDELAGADAIVFGAPTYMGSLSAPMKAFMDASSKAWFSHNWKDKIAAGFTNSASMSGDKLNSLVQLAVLAGQHGMVWVGTGMMPGGNRSDSTPDEINRVGSYLGLMTQANADQGPDVAPPSVDRKTAEAFGQRVAETTLRWRAGA
jgi:NAD(P)H dehydrogenase (quinone)